jgi:hypothetical protein
MFLIVYKSLNFAASHGSSEWGSIINTNTMEGSVGIQRQGSLMVKSIAPVTERLLV